MTKEEATKWLKGTQKGIKGGYKKKFFDLDLINGLCVEAIDMAIEALSADVVRCKDCRHRDLFSCPLADNDYQKDDDYCSWGERREHGQD